MFGWRGQRDDEHGQSLEEALANEPEHVSCHQLTAERRTRERGGDLGATPPCPPLGGEGLRGPERIVENEARFAARLMLRPAIHGLCRTQPVTSSLLMPPVSSSSSSP
jgi:hypothetical protein